MLLKIAILLLLNNLQRKIFDNLNKEPFESNTGSNLYLSKKEWREKMIQYYPSKLACDSDLALRTFIEYIVIERYYGQIDSQSLHKFTAHILGLNTKNFDLAKFKLVNKETRKKFKLGIKHLDSSSISLYKKEPRNRTEADYPPGYDPYIKFDFDLPFIINLLIMNEPIDKTDHPKLEVLESTADMLMNNFEGIKPEHINALLRHIYKNNNIIIELSKFYLDEYISKQDIQSVSDYIPIQKESFQEKDVIVKENYFSNLKYFASGKLRSIDILELENLSQTIQNWNTKSLPSDDAIRKTYDFLIHKFGDSLTQDEYLEFSSKLLNARIAAIEELLFPKGESAQPEIEETPEEITCTASIHRFSETLGYEVTIATETPVTRDSNKIGGFPHFPKDHNLNQININDVFIAKISINDFDDSLFANRKGSLYFFIPNDFEGYEYFQAKKAKVIFIPSNQELEKNTNFKKVLNELSINLRSFKSKDFENPYDCIYNGFMMNMINDTFVEDLVTLSAEKNTFDNPKKKTNIQFVTLLNLNSHWLKDSDDNEFIPFLNLVFYMDLEDFELFNFSNVYYIAEP